MRCATLVALAWTWAALAAESGYYRQPTIHGDTIVFVAEGDLWRVPVTGGVAARLTTHPGDESLPAISPDGKSIAFLGQYEGPADVYTMPLAGGRPIRRTWGEGRVTHIGWDHRGNLVISTDLESTLPSQQLVVLNLETHQRTRFPLAQAADGSFAADGTLIFTRLPFQGSQCKNYRGGTAQNLWRFKTGDAEATPLTRDYTGTSKNPLVMDDRTYFLTDRSGTMNLWSMSLAGQDLKQHTRHEGFDVMSAAGHGRRVVYQHQADLRLYDRVDDRDTLVPITLNSDFDHMREKVIPKPVEWLSSAHLSPNGDRVALTARGKVFVAPTAASKGRIVEVTRKQGVRYRSANFMPDGKSLLLMSDESGEVEFWKFPATGPGPGQRLSQDGQVLRWEGLPSPNGKWIAHHDKDQRLWLFDVEKKVDHKVAESPYGDFEGLSWSPDSQWLAYVEEGVNLMRRISLLEVSTRKSTFVTTDRFDSFDPTWSSDGKFLYFLSNRNLNTVVPGPWGIYQPEPYFDKRTKLYGLPIREGFRSPFLPKDETLDPEPAKKDLVLEGIERRIFELPIAAGNYSSLSVNDKALYVLSRSGSGLPSLLAINQVEKPTLHTVATGVSSYELSREGNKLLIRQGETLFTTEATINAGIGTAVDLGGWVLAIRPREEWKQMFVDAWRLERDYFYDRGMHGTSWDQVRKKYEPLVERVASRSDLNDVIAQMVGELSALHIFVRGGDLRKGTEDVPISSLGARLERDPKAGGYRIAHIFKHDPDEPHRASPLARPGIKIDPGDVLLEVNGVPVLEVEHPGELLRKQAGQPVLLKVRSMTDRETGLVGAMHRARGGRVREVTVRPMTPQAASDLRYHEWEYTRRLAVDEASQKSIGYVHLRAMGAGDMNDFARDFYPAFTRQGMIIDVRHNRGGNIDSWILSRLLRKAWFYWSQRVGRASSWNMQSSFRGHVVVLCNEFTASDGEAFCEGIKRLQIGKVIGTRTWGGEIWLRSNNFLVDRGIATAAEFGVFSPEGIWLIEGHGVEPDMVVDNLPHSTFNGKDAQLEKAIEMLKQMIKDDPRELPPVPKFPTPARKN